MPILFQIEYISQSEAYPYVIAKLLIYNAHFELQPKSFLGEIEIKNELTQPRALDVNGLPRFDLYIFRPKVKSQITEFRQGMILELTSIDD